MTIKILSALSTELQKYRTSVFQKKVRLAKPFKFYLYITLKLPANTNAAELTVGLFVCRSQDQSAGFI